MSVIIQPTGHRVTRILSSKIKDSVRRNKNGKAMLGSRTKTFKIENCMIFTGKGKPVEGQTVRRADLELGKGLWNNLQVEPLGKTDTNGFTRIWRVL